MSKFSGRHDVIGYVLLLLSALLIAALLLCPLGCAAESPVAASLYAYDEQWAAVLDCWGASGLTAPRVIIRSDCWVSSRGALIYAASYSPTGYATGEFDAPNTVQVCADLAALEHEMSHAASYAVRGTAGTNGEGVCGL